jgi:glycerol-3-phosphate cytidylyltransferase
MYNIIMIKGFTCGAFDLLHPGHILMLKEIRGQCDFIIIGLHTDPTIDRPEKNKPIETIEERRIRLEACKYIDEIIEYNTEADLYELLKNLNPDIRFLGADWEGKHFTGDDLLIKVIFNSRDHVYSSTNLRKRILKQE